MHNLRQSTSPVAFSTTTRRDTVNLMSSGEAGKVVCVGYVPLLRGDSAAGNFAIDVDLAEMPRPLLNAVTANVQAWFVPKSAHPQFAGMDEFTHSYGGEPINALGDVDRQPPAFFDNMFGSSDLVSNSNNYDFLRTLGIHMVQGRVMHSDVFDAFSLVYNMRLAAHSSKLDRRKYASEDIEQSLEFPPAFWPTGRLSSVVASYERALVMGSLDLDVLSGQMPNFSNEKMTDGAYQIPATTTSVGRTDGDYDFSNQIWAEMAGQTVGATLADIDMARKTQAFAKLRQSYAGNDATGFDNDDVIVADLMQGFGVDEDRFKRPWLLDAQRVIFGLSERHATDGASLADSVTTGRASVTLSCNVPRADTGGTIIFTLEVVPEKLDERMVDEWLLINDPKQLPNALRDVQNPEPVDQVLNRRVDAAHEQPDGLYGFEPMNDVWNREFTRLGGSFFQADPTNPWTEQRSAIWIVSVIDPEYTRDHFLCPEVFPKYVFSDTVAPAFEFVARHDLRIRGLTQIGDVLAEDNAEYQKTDAVLDDVQ
jgi:hypothetical protein